MYTLGSKVSIKLSRENVSLSPRKPFCSGENAQSGSLSSYSAFCSHMEAESEWFSSMEAL